MITLFSTSTDTALHDYAVGLDDYDSVPFAVVIRVYGCATERG